jgi:hypothetical protein
MSLSRFLLCTSLCTGLVAASAPGCGDDSCGPGGAPDTGLVASGGGVSVTYGHLSGSPNRDCPDASAPASVISLTIMGTQSDGTGLFTLCIGRPDLLASQSLNLGVDTSSQVRVVDLTASATNCTLAIDRSHPPTGTATSTGMCGNGSDAAGFALSIDASLTYTRTCGSTVDSVPVMLRGRVAVAGPPSPVRN